MKVLSFNNTRMAKYYFLTPIKLGCEVRGVDLNTEARPEGKFMVIHVNINVTLR
jgi:hypothetical protein